MPWHGSPAVRTVVGYMPLTPKDAIAARLLRLRQEHGSNGKDLTQHEAAGRLGVEDRQWQRWESAENAPRDETLEKIAATFDIDLAEFYEGVTTGESRLDRIEAQIAELLSRLPATDDAEAFEQDLDDADPQDETRADGTDADDESPGRRAQGK